MRETWRSDGMQFVPGPTGFERCASADVQGARREGGDLNGFAQYREPESYAVWGDNGEERVAGEEGCDQYLADEGVFGGTAGEAWYEEESGKEVEEQWGEERKRSSPRGNRDPQRAQKREGVLLGCSTIREVIKAGAKSPTPREKGNRSGNKGSRREHFGGELRYMDSRGEM